MKYAEDLRKHIYSYAPNSAGVAAWLPKAREQLDTLLRLARNVEAYEKAITTDVTKTADAYAKMERTMIKLRKVSK